MTTAPLHPVRHVDVGHTDTRRADGAQLRLAYREAGDPDAPVLLLLHALGESSLSWDPLLDDLAALGYRALALDARGHGDSDRPGEYTYELMTADTLAFCDVLAPTPGGIAIVGHSMGAVTAALVTTALTVPPTGDRSDTFPGRVTRLVLEDATPTRPGGPRFEPFDEPDHPVPFDWPLVNALRAQRSDPPPAWWSEALKIEAPVLVVAGGPTSNVDQADLKDFAAGVADGRLVEIPVGHMVHDEAPAEFLAAVAEFLRP
ncbi:alpha-beta hydrolase superfamily lysophospholipase [Promicromonospora sp. AC04]|uniref:alpha/beta fold hydrolase n=1 Tax=Promicromonospora sp. AC04 TaxID=2135723 RepID=UPI000D35EDAA|nr:alpha/beta hydrolase [Promicromonospora sp. AC04]PUB26258.1 alpha-beta hydrolase superfamily lysophospholipase [Promicromonospora sp. AC04]